LLEKINASKKKIIHDNLINWEETHFEFFPWRKTKNKFHGLIAELMLQRTKADQVLNVYNEFTKRYPTILSAKREEKEKLFQVLRPLGLNWRINNIIKLISKLDLEIPDSYVELIKLPGVGNYVASAFLTFHSDICLPIIDSNVVRLYSRLFGFNFSGELRRKKWFIDFSKEMLPAKKCVLYNYSLLDFPRKICKPNPLHSKCPLKQVCFYYSQYQ
jgi:A/G-specific adenine glycosylase